MQQRICQRLNKNGIPVWPDVVKCLHLGNVLTSLAISWVTILCLAKGESMLANILGLD